jgi:hypothetical protein
VRDHEGITLDAVYGLSVIQVFNDLAYLKAYKAHMKQLNKEASAQINIQ